MKHDHFFTIIFTLSVLAFLFLTSCAVGVKKEIDISDEEQAQMDRVLDSISGEKLLDYVKKLSSDSYTGRLSGTPEYKACADWVGSLFQEWGFMPRGENGAFLQAYPNPYTVVFVGGELSYTYKSRGQRRKKKYTYEKEYFPGSQSADGSFTAEVVYVGYGITAPEMDYDDYAGVNVKEKIVLIEPDAPVSPETEPELYKDWRPYSFNQYKIKMAVAHGAKGVLFNDLTVNPDIDHVPRLRVAQVGDAVVKDLFAGTGKTHQENLAEIQSSLQPQSFRTHKVFTIHNFTEHHPKGIGYNVLGQIEGIDPLLKQEVIILGANLDHLGFCYEIMPGANDNASGVALLLGVAEGLSKSPVKPKRSVLFIAFGSKEQAFKGAQAYLKKPAFPKNKTIAYLNLSMVGCGDKVRALGAQDYPELWATISQATAEYPQLALEAFPYSNPGRPRLDSDLFLDRGIPSITFTVYGAPTFARTRKDRADTINPSIMQGLLKVLYRAVLAMANSGQDFFEKK
jgi:hypothetical protein